jgi:peptide/nickel transport system substrate-binding protein
MTPGGIVQAPLSQRARWRRLLAVVAAGSILAAGCGGSDDDDDGDGAAPTVPEVTQPDTEPVRGGTLTYAVEADTASPWLPSGMLCAAACHSTVGRSIFEPLAVLGDDGNVYPYLLESIEPNEDYTVWTLTVREGIKFHDGTDLDADAVADNLERNRNGALLVATLRPIVSVESDGALTVTVTMNETWPSFDVYLNSQLGYMGSPTWFAAVEAGTADATEPVGTGPFAYESYESGDNGRLTATRFEDYWRGDGPNSVTGEGLPYLDGIEVRFIPDSQARTSGLLAGDLDLIQTSNGVEISELGEEDGIVVDTLENPYEVETSYLLINNSAEVGGAPNPFADPRVRRALALATNNQQLQDTRTGGLFPVANGPFPPGVMGNLEDTGFPQYDPEAATALLEEIEADTGSPVTIAYKTTNDPFNLTTAELLKGMWEEVGFSVTIDQIPQGEFINQAIGGNFQVFGWRNHGGVDPDQQFVWWSSTTAEGIALNFGRIVDPEVDRLLTEIRTATDDETRTAAAEELNRYFGEQVFNVWNNWVYWSLAHSDTVFNVEGHSIPGVDDVRAINMGANLPGVIMPTEIFETEE